MCSSFTALVQRMFTIRVFDAIWISFHIQHSNDFYCATRPTKTNMNYFNFLFELDDLNSRFQWLDPSLARWKIDCIRFSYVRFAQLDRHLLKLYAIVTRSNSFHIQFNFTFTFLPNNLQIGQLKTKNAHSTRSGVAGLIEMQTVVWTELARLQWQNDAGPCEMRMQISN